MQRFVLSAFLGPLNFFKRSLSEGLLATGLPMTMVCCLLAEDISGFAWVFRTESPLTAWTLLYWIVSAIVYLIVTDEQVVKPVIDNQLISYKEGR